MKRIFVAGEVLVEIMANTTGAGFLKPIALTGPFPSGAPAIFADQAGLLGQPVSLASCVGNDDFGTLNIKHLEAHGVDTSAIQIHPDRPTGSAFVRYNPNGARDFIFNIAHSACGAFQPDAATQKQIDQSDHIHVVGSSLNTPVFSSFILETVRAIKTKGGTVSFDPNIRKEIMHDAKQATILQEILRACDLYLPSDQEIGALTPDIPHGNLIKYLLDLGIKTIVHKNGQDGATLYDQEDHSMQQGFPTNEVDPTGAGDCFGAVFTSLWLRKHDLKDALRLAAAAGAMAVSYRGPMAGNSPVDKILAFVQKMEKS